MVLVYLAADGGSVLASLGAYEVRKTALYSVCIIQDDALAGVAVQVTYIPMSELKNIYEFLRNLLISTLFFETLEEVPSNISFWTFNHSTVAFTVLDVSRHSHYSKILLSTRNQRTRKFSRKLFVACLLIRKSVKNVLTGS